MRKWNLLSVLTAIVLLAVLPVGVFAEDGTGLSVSLSTDKSSAAVGENITYTYFISNTGNVTMDNLALEDEKLGAIAMSVTSLAIGENITANQAV